MILESKFNWEISRLAAATSWFILATKINSGEPARPCGHWELLAERPGITRCAFKSMESDRFSILTPYDQTSELGFNATRRGDPQAQEIANETARSSASVKPIIFA
jgi:hypothetical protein